MFVAVGCAPNNANVRCNILAAQNSFNDKKQKEKKQKNNGLIMLVKMHSTKYTVLELLEI